MTDVVIAELRARLRYEPDTGLLYWRDGEKFSGRRAFAHVSSRGYNATSIKIRSTGKLTTMSAHRVAWAIHYGEHPTGQIDHINGNKTDNRISNLRDVVNAENAKNLAMKSNNTSGVNGVYKHSQTGKWTAQINAGGKTIGLGCFERIEDAIIARKAAERVLMYHENHGR